MITTTGQASEEDVKLRQAKAMADPEVQNILMDPIMRQVRPALAWVWISQRAKPCVS
jgi:hypothetical protein